MRNVIYESALVAVAGVIFAFAANGLSPNGLKLSRNYSPGGALASTRPLQNNGGTNKTNALELIQKQLAAEGLNLANSNQVLEFFNDPAREQGLIAFVDARNDEHYQEGHVPGAFQLDHYYPERYLATVLPACQVAQKILIYCKGGSCEDSEQTAIFLREAGIPKERLFVYAGGFDEWLTNHLPVETGERNSGRIEHGAPVSGAEGTK